jgi:hypothetical protein
VPKHFPPEPPHRKAADERLLAALPTGRETVPIHRARKHVALGLIEGTDCPVCGQHAQLYRRRISATVARQLIDVFGAVGTDVFATRDHTTGGGDFAKLAHWGLIAEQPQRRQDGGAAGRWRITRDGVAFLEGRARVPEYVLIYDGQRIGYDGDTVGIASIVEGFDLRDVQAADAGDADRELVTLPPEAPGTPAAAVPSGAS